MMRSLFSGVSGLKNHQTRMDVIGNNISNVNTYGFKTSRVTFQDMLSQTLSGAAKPEENVGGVNPKQVGLGMTIASIDRIFTQGSIQTTGNQTDLAISGDGFFMVSNGDKNFFTRAGTFSLDRDGNLVNPANGLKVQGWMAERNEEGEMILNSKGTPQDVVVPIYSKVEAKETTVVKYKCNLDSKKPVLPENATPKMIASAAVTTNIDVYDNLGNPHRMTLNLWHTGVNEWTASASMSDANGPVTLDIPGMEGANQENSSSKMILRFSPDGRLIAANDEGTADGINQGNIFANLNYRIDGDPNVRNIRLDLGKSGLVEGITQFSSPSTTKAVEQDGYSMGYMEGFNIDNSGVITGVYSNGVKQAIGQVSMAVFTNPGGLTAVGENLFEVSNNSGLANIGEANQGGRGKIVAGALEMSNVDLSDQFTDMIITQRGFQANSRTITTSDQMLQELINLKR
ncbi:MAG TPA: flagellar hook protein FlgE [Spirochaetota bacterium]|nr:flagellar hook protein FlgE [Spirochaetota bacterium]HOH36610.1 flagellar hook protein FlgE [Spirochaetota bacterium]HPM34886.1 flagellar hook protein FlgE [Spirochaetota bacterium]HPW51592.1 flagellar hook protein FlgE [Spirochaetota bacterium]HPY02079.1 flagellar hook protein FlgE [Spirochaetota bacterium]